MDDPIYCTDDNCYLGIKVNSFTSQSVYNIPFEEILKKYYTKYLYFLTYLMQSPEEDYTYDIRLLNNPGKKGKSSTNIDVYFIVKTSAKNKDNLRTFTKSTLNLIEVIFDDIEFSICDKKTTPKILNPFKIKHIFEIKRKSEYVLLDSLIDTKNFKFDTPTHTNFPKNEYKNAIYQVYPFLKNNNSNDVLFKLIATEDIPVMISMIIRPLILSDKIKVLFEQQIINCERFAQIGISGMSSDVEKLFPTLQERARINQRFLSEKLQRLTNNLGYFQARIAFPSNVSQSILQALYNILTGYAVELQNIDHSIYNSGVMVEHTKKELTKNIISINNLSIEKNTNDLDKLLSDLNYIYDFNELSSIFQFPIFTSDNIKGINIKNYKFYDVPSNMPSAGTFLGINKFGRKETEIRIEIDDKRRHTYIFGQTGTGKSTLLKSMIMSDIENGSGVCVFDPHGDLFEELKKNIPSKRLNDVIIINPVDKSLSTGINLLEYKSDEQKYFIIQEMIAILKRLLQDEYHEGYYNLVGPVFFQHIYMNLLLIMSRPEEPSTLLDFYNIFNKKNYWKNWLPLTEMDDLLSDWVENILPNTDYLSSHSGTASLGGYVSSKFSQFIFDPLLRRIFTMQHSTIDFGEAMDQGKIILINLAKGELSELNSSFLGMILLAKLQATAMGRIKVAKSMRKDFHIYVDEFQNMATENFVTLLSEGRKFRVSLTLANQFLTQIPPKIQNSIMGNVGTFIAFRIGQQDAENVERIFGPDISIKELINLPNWHAFVSSIVKGQKVPPFSLLTELRTF